MPVFEGTAISGTIFLGKVKIYKHRPLPSYPKSIKKFKVKEEVKKLRHGIHQLEDDIRIFLNDPEISQLDKDILNTHLLIVTDIEITQILEKAITENLQSAPQAVASAFNMIISNFEQMDNNYFAQRADDYKDVAHRLMGILLDDKEPYQVVYAPDDIIFMREITPSLVSVLAKSNVKAYCTERGSYTSHSSILSRAMGLTSMVSKTDIISSLSDGMPVILNPAEGKILVQPSEQEKDFYQKKLQEIIQKEAVLRKRLQEPAITLDKIVIPVKANIEFPGEISQVLENYSDGVGLFRTEFIYLNRNSFPDEEEQTKVYSEILSQMKDKQVTIRTFDLGGDKLTYMQQYSREENPNLGCRGIRFSLEQKRIFQTQVRAILRASVKGNAAIMFPMIISLQDFQQAREIVSECMSELDKEGLPYNNEIPVGAMIETPSAALCSDNLAKVCDFFSLGTNDLVQYTLAVDRNNNKVAPYYIQHHPAVLMLIKKTISAAKKAGIPVSICGEMASELMYIPLLVGMGIDEISINPSHNAAVKAVIRNCDSGLTGIISGLDFSTDLPEIEHLLKITLKPYYTIQ